MADLEEYIEHVFLFLFNQNDRVLPKHSHRVADGAVPQMLFRAYVRYVLIVI